MEPDILELYQTLINQGSLQSIPRDLVADVQVRKYQLTRKLILSKEQTVLNRCLIFQKFEDFLYRENGRRLGPHYHYIYLNKLID